MNPLVEQDYESAYLLGLKDGIRRFAWWKNGTEFVGSCGMTLKQALEEVDKVDAQQYQKRNY